MFKDRKAQKITHENAQQPLNHKNYEGVQFTIS